MEEMMNKINVEILENNKKIADLIVKNMKLARETERRLIVGVIDDFFCEGCVFMNKQDFENIKQAINLNF